jgi:hypothetical protein
MQVQTIAMNSADKSRADRHPRPLGVRRYAYA